MFSNIAGIKDIGISTLVDGIMELDTQGKAMTVSDLGQLVLLLAPAMLISALLLFTFAAGG